MRGSLLAKLCGLLMLALLALSGCQGGMGLAGAAPDQAASRPARVVDPNLEETIVGVIAYYNSFNPWLWNDSKTKPIGIDVQALYLAGPKSKGVFGNGVIRPRLYVHETANGQDDYRLAKEWSFDVQQAVPWRSNKTTVQGMGYRIPLVWEDLDLIGREIRMIIAFERSDGKLVLSSKKDFRVPGPAPAQRASAQ